MVFNYYISNREDGNMSFYAGSGDVLVNRKLVCSKLNLQLDDFVVMNQCHSADFLVATIEHKGRGAYSFEDAISDVDALVTKENNLVLMVQGADCPLLAVYNEKSGVVAAIHSGWKGTRAGIISNVLQYMKEEMHCNHEHTSVIIAPFAKGCCYEVGEEFRGYFDDSALNVKGDVLFLNLEDVINTQLLSCGIKQENIRFEDGCTMCGNVHYSYRKEGKESGRFCMLVWISS